MSTDTGQQETEEFLPRARMRVKLEYADTMEEGALWHELERRYNAHDDLVAALTWMVDQFEDYHDADLEPHQVEQLDGWRAAMDVLDGKSWTPPKAEGA